jgi:MFS family permease
MDSIDESALKKARQATLFIFLLCGITVSCWAPLVPIVKRSLQLNEAKLGLILLSMGAGAIVTMPLIAPVIQKYGSRTVIFWTSVLSSLMLPVLTLVNNAYALTAALFLFGASLGSLDVAMNAQAVVVQEKLKRHIMSSFHGMFSVGGLTGAFGLGILMYMNLSPAISAIIITCLMLIIAFTQTRHFLDHPKNDKTEKVGFRIPKGPIIILGLSCFFIFLSEGAMLDWSAVFLQEYRHFTVSLAGTGYAVFSVAMATMRFTGDRLINLYGPGKIVLWGALTAATGLLMATCIPSPLLSVLGFMFVGLGAANIVPVLFSSAGRSRSPSPEAALASVTTMGYAGQLAGPALIGFIAQVSSLPFALGILALPLFIVAFAFRKTKVH